MMKQSFKFTILISIFLFFAELDKTFSNPISDNGYVKNQLNLNVNIDFFNFPLEVCGVYLVYPQNGATIKIDSFLYLNFRPNTRIIDSEEKISHFEFKEKYSDIYNQIEFNLPESFQELFKLYKVKFIGRVIKSFVVSDTIPKIRTNTTGKKFESKSPNYNKYLKIIFPEKYDAVQIKSEFEQLSYVTSVELNQEIKYDTIEDPRLVEKENPKLADSLKNKFLDKTVVITVTVTEDGSIEEARIFKSVNSFLDSLSLEAAQKCKFEPAIRNGNPIRVKYNIPFKF